MHLSRHAVSGPVLWLLAAMILILPGCKGGTPIKTLLDDPTQFDGKEVRIAGAVVHSIGVLGTGAYEVDDGTGKLVVVSKDSGAPREGARVAVKGVFRSAFMLGTKSASVLVESERLTE